MWIERQIINRITRCVRSRPAVLLTGARQAGKFESAGTQIMDTMIEAIGGMLRAPVYAAAAIPI